jgi:hypothetical protein
MATGKGVFGMGVLYLLVCDFRGGLAKSSSIPKALLFFIFFSPFHGSPFLS